MAEIDDPPLFRQGYGPPILFMGDSRAAMGGIMSGLLNTVYNLGVGGSTLRSVIVKLHRIPDINPRMVFLFTGVNDTAYPYDEFVSNLNFVSDFFYERNIPLVIMDHTVNPAFSNPVQFVLWEWEPAMKEVRNTKYLPVQYDSNCFIDHVHINVLGYMKVWKAITDSCNGFKKGIIN